MGQEMASGLGCCNGATDEALKAELEKQRQNSMQPSFGIMSNPTKLLCREDSDSLVDQKYNNFIDGQERIDNLKKLE